MSTANPSNLKDLLNKTKSAASKSMVLPESFTIPLVISGYKEENGEYYAKGTNFTNGQECTVKLVTQLKEDGTKRNRSMADIEEVSPVGSTVIFQSCFPDKDNSNRFTSYYAQTPHNIIEAEGQTKEVSILVQPTRLLKTKAGRVASVLYGVTEGQNATSQKEAYDAAAKLFGDKKGVYMRVRLNTEQDGETIEQNEAFEFFPVYDKAVDENGNTTSSEVNVEQSLRKITESTMGQLWLSQLDDGLKDYIGNGVDIDIMPMEILWSGVARIRDGKSIIEDSRFGLGKPNGLFASETEIFQDENNQKMRKYNNVATNMIVSKMTLTDASGERSMFLGASAFSTKAKFVNNHNLPIVVNGERKFMPAQDKFFIRNAKSDGTFELERKEAPVAAVAAAPAEQNASTQVEVEAPVVAAVEAPAAAEVEMDDIEIDLPAQDVQDDIMQNMESDFGGLDIDIDDVLSDFDSAPAPTMTMAR